jgi:hypothetical protein
MRLGDLAAPPDQMRQTGLMRRLIELAIRRPAIPHEDAIELGAEHRGRFVEPAAILKAGGSLQPSSGPPHHHDLYGLTPQQFDAILGVPEPNPVPKLDRWQPS